jgi:hypothetical protein
MLVKLISALTNLFKHYSELTTAKLGGTSRVKSTSRTSSKLSNADIPLQKK